MLTTIYWRNFILSPDSLDMMQNMLKNKECDILELEPISSKKS